MKVMWAAALPGHVPPGCKSFPQTVSFSPRWLAGRYKSLFFFSKLFLSLRKGLRRTTQVLTAL
jgi:hypothetical protein